MYGLLSEGLKFTSEHKKFLQNLVIDASGPGTILHDFDALLNILKDSAFQLTPRHQLPLRALAEINARLIHPIQLGLKRPQQKSYPHIQGLYLLVRASGLTTVDETGKQPTLILDEEMLQRWITLNPAERYGSLLEAWLLRGRLEIISERGRSFGLIPENFESAASFYVRIPGDGLPVAGNRNTEESLKYSPEWHNLGLLDLFGLVRIPRDAPHPGQGWQIERVHRTPLGDALLALLYSEFFEDMLNIFRLEDEGKVPFGVLQPVLQPYFLEWKNNLTVPEWTFREGTYIFKVALGPVWRRIAIRAGHTLDTLVSIILDSVDFDDDHLYQFSYQTRYGFPQHINHPYLEEEPFTSEILIGDVPLSVGQTMIFLFDFGDNWEFDVTLERVDTERVTKKPGILETHGKSPEQYPNWGDWE